MALPLTNSQVRILKTLLRNPNGLTRDQLSDKSEVVCDADVLGPVREELIETHPESLVAYRLVQCSKDAPGMPNLFTLTPSGLEAANQYSARKRGAGDNKVPPEHLDMAVLSVRNLKPYGLELFTDDDVKQVRALLPDDYQEVPITLLRQQIVNRRKVGAYSKNRVTLPHWYSQYREMPEFKQWAGKVLEYYGGCALDPSHKEGLEVWHRRFVDHEQEMPIVGSERIKDGIALCGACRKRQARFMCEVPSERPE